MKTFDQFSKVNEDNKEIQEADDIKTQAKNLIKALEAFKKAAMNLNDAWQEADDIAGTGPMEDKYPENWESYEDEAYGISDWALDAISKLKKVK